MMTSLGITVRSEVNLARSWMKLGMGCCKVGHRTYASPVPTGYQSTKLINFWIDYTIRVPLPGWRNATPNSILAEFQDEKGGVMGTFSFLHNLHCLVRAMLPSWLRLLFYANFLLIENNSTIHAIGLLLRNCGEVQTDSRTSITYSYRYEIQPCLTEPELAKM